MDNSKRTLFLYIIKLIKIIIPYLYERNSKIPFFKFLIMGLVVNDVQGITFDLFNTLMGSNSPPSDIKGISDYLVENGIDIYPQEFEAARQYVFFHDMPIYEISNWFDWTSQILKRLDVSAEPKLIDNLIRMLSKPDKDVFLFEDVIENVRSLSENYVLSIVTTIPDFRFNHVLGPIREYMQIIVTGQNAKCVKGNRKMYEFDLAQKNVSAANNLFVGDDPLYDIYYPKKLGMQTIEIARNGEFKSKDADGQIRGLKELTNILL